MGIHGLFPWLLGRWPTHFRECAIESLLTKERNVFLVDGSAWQYTIYHGGIEMQADVVCGGQWSLLFQRVEFFLRCFQRMGCRLVFIFDAMRPKTKRIDLARSAANSARLLTRLLRVMDGMDHENPKAQEELLAFLPQDVLVPEFAGDVAAAALLHLRSQFPNVEVYVAAGDAEADSCIVQYCLQHKGKVAGILTNDNDFMLLPHGTSMIRMENLNWERLLKNHTPRCSRVVHTQGIVSSLGGPEGTALFAVLVGTDMCEPYFMYESGAKRLDAAYNMAATYVGKPITEAIHALADASKNWSIRQNWRTNALVAAAYFTGTEHDGQPIPLLPYSEQQPVPDDYIDLVRVRIRHLLPGSWALLDLSMWVEYFRHRRAAGSQPLTAQYCIVAPRVGGPPGPSLPPAAGALCDAPAPNDPAAGEEDLGGDLDEGDMAGDGDAVASPTSAAAQAETSLDEEDDTEVDDGCESPTSARDEAAGQQSTAGEESGDCLAGPPQRCPPRSGGGRSPAHGRRPAADGPAPGGPSSSKSASPTASLADTVADLLQELLSRGPIRFRARIVDLGAEGQKFFGDALSTATPMELLARILCPGTRLLDAASSPLAPELRLVVATVEYLLQKQVIQPTDVPVVLATVAFCQEKLHINHDNALAAKGKKVGKPLDERERTVHIGGIGLNHPLEKVEKALRQAAETDVKIQSFEVDRFGVAKVCVAVFPTSHAAYLAKEKLSGRQMLGSHSGVAVVIQHFHHSNQLIPCPTGVALAAQAQGALHTAFLLNAALGALPEVSYQPWRWFDGVTFQLLQQCFGTALETFATRDVKVHLMAMLNALKAESTQKGMAAVGPTYTHHCVIKKRDGKMAIRLKPAPWSKAAAQQQPSKRPAGAPARLHPRPGLTLGAGRPASVGPGAHPRHRGAPLDSLPEPESPESSPVPADFHSPAGGATPAPAVSAAPADGSPGKTPRRRTVEGRALRWHAVLLSFLLHGLVLLLAAVAYRAMYHGRLPNLFSHRG
eukprot:EG_transcript_1434